MTAAPGSDLVAPAEIEVTVCVALHRGGRWLLSVRGRDVAHAPGTIGLIGGHLELRPEPADGEAALLEPDVLENNGRREVREETGIDLTGAPLRYLGSEAFRSDGGAVVLAVTFVAEVPAGIEPVVAAPAELSEVGWWSPAELAADPRCVPWTLRLCRQAAEVIG